MTPEAKLYALECIAGVAESFMSPESVAAVVECVASGAFDRRDFGTCARIAGEHVASIAETDAVLTACGFVHAWPADDATEPRFDLLAKHEPAHDRIIAGAVGLYMPAIAGLLVFRAIAGQFEGPLNVIMPPFMEADRLRTEPIDRAASLRSIVRRARGELES